MLTRLFTVQVIKVVLVIKGNWGKRWAGRTSPVREARRHETEFRPERKSSDKRPERILPPGIAIFLKRHNEPPVHWPLLIPRDVRFAIILRLKTLLSPPFKPVSLVVDLTQVILVGSEHAGYAACHGKKARCAFSIPPKQLQK